MTEFNYSNSPIVIELLTDQLLAKVDSALLALKQIQTSSDKNKKNKNKQLHARQPQNHYQKTEAQDNTNEWTDRRYIFTLNEWKEQSKIPPKRYYWHTTKYHQMKSQSASFFIEQIKTCQWNLLYCCEANEYKWKYKKRYYKWWFSYQVYNQCLLSST